MASVGISVENVRSDIHRLQTELERLSKIILKQSSFLTQMRKRYLHLLSRDIKKKKWFEKKIYRDERASSIIEQDSLSEFIADGLKPARYVFFFFA